MGSNDTMLYNDIEQEQIIHRPYNSNHCQNINYYVMITPTNIKYIAKNDLWNGKQVYKN